MVLFLSPLRPNVFGKKKTDNHFSSNILLGSRKISPGVSMIKNILYNLIL